MKKLVLIICLTCLFGCRSELKSKPADYRNLSIALASIIKNQIETDATEEEIAIKIHQIYESKRE